MQTDFCDIITLSTRMFDMRYLISVMILIFSIPCFAADSYYCPHSSSYVHPGDSYEHVIETCGKPISTTTDEVQPTATRKVIQWIYDYDHTKTIDSGVNHPDKNVLVIEISNDKVISIVLKGKDVTETNYCRYDIPLTLGESSYQAEFLCGFASSKRTFTALVSKTPIQQNVLSYQINSLYPKAKLYFQQGKLIKIED